MGYGITPKKHRIFVNVLEISGILEESKRRNKAGKERGQRIGGRGGQGKRFGKDFKQYGDGKEDGAGLRRIRSISFVPVSTVQYMKNRTKSMGSKIAVKMCQKGGRISERTVGKYMGEIRIRACYRKHKSCAIRIRIFPFNKGHQTYFYQRLHTVLR